MLILTEMRAAETGRKKSGKYTYPDIQLLDAHNFYLIKN